MGRSGSNHEPVYPPDGIGGGNVHAVDAFEDLNRVQNVSHIDDNVNTLSKVVAGYPPPIPVILSPVTCCFSIHTCSTALIPIELRTVTADLMCAITATPGLGFLGIMTDSKGFG